MLGFNSMRERGKVRTPLWCHDCRKDFVAALDYDLDGNHVINCPHCNHEHCRVIKDGVVTGDRWDSRNGDSAFYYTAGSGSVWVATSSTTSSTSGSYFITTAWLNHGTNS